MAESLPWHNHLLVQFAGRISAGKLPHALLVTGIPGIGKLALARDLAALLLCTQPAAGGHSCGECRSCSLLAAGSNPDFLYVEPQEDSKAIKVDQVRALSDSLALCAHGQGFKVAIVAPADAMNINAANSLLKTLEEPSDNTVLVLVSDRPAQLPATIRSRCQLVRVHAPDPAEAITWLAGQVDDAGQAQECLQLAAGAPLAALELAAGGVVEERRQRLDELVDVLEGRRPALETAQSWGKDEDMQGLHWMRDWLMDMVRIRMTGQAGEIRNIDLADKLGGLARQLDSRIMFRQLDTINRALGAGTASLNRQLMTEDILLAWAARQ